MPTVVPFLTLVLIIVGAVFLGFSEADTSAVTAVGTLSAVGIALLRDFVWQRVRRPSLTIETLSGHRDSGDTVKLDHGAMTSIWYRLPVTNARGRETARSVEVTIEQISNLSSSASPLAVHHLTTVAGRQLKWADRSSPSLDIPAGASRRIDLIHLDTYRGSGPSRLVVTLWDPRRDPDHGPRLASLHKGRYRLVMSLTAENADARCFEAELSWDGDTYPTLGRVKRRWRGIRLC